MSGARARSRGVAGHARHRGRSRGSAAAAMSGAPSASVLELMVWRKWAARKRPVRIAGGRRGRASVPSAAIRPRALRQREPEEGRVPRVASAAETPRVAPADGSSRPECTSSGVAALRRSCVVLGQRSRGAATRRARHCRRARVDAAGARGGERRDARSGLLGVRRVRLAARASRSSAARSRDARTVLGVLATDKRRVETRRGPRGGSFARSRRRTAAADHHCAQTAR